MSLRWTSLRRFLAGTTLLACAALTAPAAFAQQDGRWEFNLFGGGSFGTRVSLTPSADTRIGIAPAWGLRVSYGITKAFALETSYSHASPDLSSTNPATGLPIGTPTSVNINTYEVNGLFGWGRGRWKGYAGLGIGAMTLDPSSSTAALPGSTTRFAANAAVGTKFFFTDNLAFRLDARYRWKAAPSHVGTVVCGGMGCHTFTTNIYSSRGGHRAA